MQNQTYTMQNNAAIFESIFDRNFSETGNIEFLEKISKEHPYFSPAQFFLLQQTATGTEAFDSQAVKTNILFNNPHWLHYQLQQPTNETKIILPQTEKTEPVIKMAEPVIEIAETAVEKVEPPPEMTAAVIEKKSGVDRSPSDEADNTEDTVDMEKEIEPMKIELKIPQERTIPNEAMLFEPMHMVDYFASQGIKLTEEMQTADKLGKQLKSFTEWLKTMKKVHVMNTTDLDIKPDDNIQALAETSNAEPEVLTEAMAEVFVKQGKRGKAGEVYQKLSLLNPHKSAYFAAKIENLKGI